MLPIDQEPDAQQSAGDHVGAHLDSDLSAEVAWLNDRLLSAEVRRAAAAHLARAAERQAAV
jgi:hypothetical protein